MGNRQNRSLVQSVNGGTSTNTATLYVHNKLNQMTGLSQSTGGGTATLTAFAYDAGGNMTAQAQNNGGSNYTYDDADRLISLVQKDTATGAYTKKSEYVYDGYSRKVISREYSWDVTLNSGAGGWTLNEEKRRVCDGMDVVQERDATNTTKVNYTRSGNIGGLLARSDTSGNYFFSYDGSGNVVGLTNASQQSVAEYSYDAWGNTLRATGAMASVNAYRYSTKELQSASGLYDYGFRFYSPGLGRWINRDPIKEEGGLNLYGFVGNDPVNEIDAYGLYFGVDDAIFTGGGALLGVGGQAASDLLAGQWSGWEDYAGSAIGGAAGGEALLYTGPVGAGAIGGAAGNAAKQGFKNLTGKQCGFDWGSFGRDTGLGAATGFIPGAKIPGITAGRGTYNAVFKQMVTKFERGQIENITAKTAGKMFIGRAVDKALVPGQDVGSGIDGVTRRFSSQ